MSDFDSSVFERMKLERTRLLQRNDPSAYLERVVPRRGHLVIRSLSSSRQLYTIPSFEYHFLASTSRGLVDSADLALEKEMELYDVREKIKKPEVVRKHKREVERLDYVLQSEQNTEDLWYLTLRTNPNMINVFGSDIDGSDVEFFSCYDDVLKYYGAKGILFKLEGGKKSFTELCSEPLYGRTILALDGLERLGLIKGESSRNPETSDFSWKIRGTVKYVPVGLRDVIALYRNKSYEMIKQRDVSSAITVNQRVLLDAKRLKLYDNISKILSLEGELAKARRYISEVNKMLGTQTEQEESFKSGKG